MVELDVDTPMRASHEHVCTTWPTGRSSYDFDPKESVELSVRWLSGRHLGIFRPSPLRTLGSLRREVEVAAGLVRGSLDAPLVRLILGTEELRRDEMLVGNIVSSGEMRFFELVAIKCRQVHFASPLVAHQEVFEVQQPMRATSNRVPTAWVFATFDADYELVPSSDEEADL